MAKKVRVLEITKDFEERRTEVTPALFVRVTKLDLYEVRHFVYTQKVLRPKSQMRGPFLYGPFQSAEDAFGWAKEKGVINHLVLKI